MGSLFINAGLAAGVALAAVPVILHLFMKQTPKHIIFPALRLIKERQKRSRKRLRVKNWLLLAARMLLIALMALALARPRIHATASLGTGDEPTALAFVFDTSLSMGYKERDKTRLDEAKELARQVLKGMNDQSRVFVIDSSDPGPPIASTPAAARKKIDGLQIRAVNRTLNGAMGAAYTAVAAVDLTRREVYVLTDLAASQWQSGQEVEGLAQATKTLKKGGKIDTFVLKVGAKEVRDVAIVSAEPASPVATEDDPVILKVKLRNIGPKTSRVVEIRLDGKPEPRAKIPVEIPASSEIDVPPLVTPKLESGVHQIEVKIVGEPDPMDFDDVRYITVDVQPAIKILVISDVAIDAQFVASVLDPPGLPANVPRPFQVERVLTRQLDGAFASKSLKGYAGIFVLNVKELTDTWWSRLSAYVRDGGGLVVAPAGYALPENYNRPLPSELLPATLGAVRVHKDADPPLRFGKPDLGSPIFEQNQKELLAELSRVPIYKSWGVTPDTGAHVLLSYTDDSPALLEKTFSGPRPGKVLMWTTALSRRPSDRDPQAWNDFPSTFVGWGFLAVMDQTAYYLAGAAGQRLVFESGEDALLATDPTKPFASYQVRGPDGKASDRTAEPAGTGNLLVAAPGEIGQWKLFASAKDGTVRDLGFSVNPPRGEIQAATLEAGDLDILFGKGKYQLATDAQSLKHVQGVAIYGREIFPWVMAIILLIVTLENLLANTFYREKTSATAVVARAA